MIRFPRHLNAVIDRQEITLDIKDPDGALMRPDHKMLVLQEDRDGFRHWVCPCPVFTRNKWCDHTVKFYSTRRVGGDVFDTSPAVTIFAGKTWLIVPCLLIPDDFNEDLAQVQVVWGKARRINNQGFAFDGSDVIGYVEKFDGRMDLRRLIVEWLPVIPSLYPGEMECGAAYHSRYDSMTECQFDPGILDSVSGPLTLPNGEQISKEAYKKRLYADSFNLLDAGVCTTCDQAAWIDTEDV